MSVEEIKESEATAETLEGGTATGSTGQEERQAISEAQEKIWQEMMQEGQAREDKMFIEFIQRVMEPDEFDEIRARGQLPMITSTTPSEGVVWITATAGGAGGANYVPQKKAIYDCPDCIVAPENRNCSDCARTYRNHTVFIEPKVAYPGLFPPNPDFDPCAGCGNNPKNGGTGVCCCALPYMYGRGRVTCKTE